MKKKIIVGNWKMNPVGFDQAKKISSSIKKIASKLSSNTEVVICPPPLFLKPLKGNFKTSVSFGAQNGFYEDQGSFTGEISLKMLKELGVEYVILGHSERREMGETDEFISKKVNACLNLDMTPILCIGEKIRDEGGSHLDILKKQIKDSLNKIPKKIISKLIIAYEPIWAIGAKEAMKPEQVLEMSLFIKKILADIYGHSEAMDTQILYGGSVNFRNAADIVNIGKVDGLLVGRESLNPEGFKELLLEVDKK